MRIKKPKYRQQIGAWGERQAEQYLLDHGLIMIERNYRTPFGELDLVMSHGEQLVFIEVKTRSSNKFGWPEDAVTEKKQDHLVKAAEQYLAEHPEVTDNWRVDVVSVTGKPGRLAPEIMWFENALA